MKYLLQEFVSFIYPIRCLYCQELVEKFSHFLCSECLTKISLAYDDPKEEVVYCFEKESPANELLGHYLTTRSEKILTQIVSWIIIKFCQMNWEMPDLIVGGIEKEFSLFQKRGININLARALAKALNVEFDTCLTYELDPNVFDSRGHLQGKVILRKKLRGLEGKKILMIQTQSPLFFEECKSLLEKEGALSCRLITFLP